MALDVLCHKIDLSSVLAMLGQRAYSHKCDHVGLPSLKLGP